MLAQIASTTVPSRRMTSCRNADRWQRRRRGWATFRSGRRDACGLTRASGVLPGGRCAATWDRGVATRAPASARTSCRGSRSADPRRRPRQPSLPRWCPPRIGSGCLLRTALPARRYAPLRRRRHRAARYRSSAWQWSTDPSSGPPRACRRARPASHASMLRNIHAAFSCTCMRWVSRSHVGSSPTSSARGKASRAVRTTVS